jgi:hypothetical protein
MIKKNVGILTLVILLSICAVMLASCFGQTARVEGGLVRDTIFSAEKSVGGTWGIFMTHDESVVYCTPDNQLGERARDLLLEHDGEVIIEFSSKEIGKDTEGKTWGSDQCQKYCSGVGDGYSCFSTVILDDIRPVPMRTGEYRG